MPIATYRQGTHMIGPKVIPAPKQASLRAWWNECRKVFKEVDIGLWRPEIFHTVDERTIHFTWGPHDIFIARRRG